MISEKPKKKGHFQLLAGILRGPGRYSPTILDRGSWKKDLLKRSTRRLNLKDRSSLCATASQIQAFLLRARRDYLEKPKRRISSNRGPPLLNWHKFQKRAQGRIRGRSLWGI